MNYKFVLVLLLAVCSQADAVEPSAIERFLLTALADIDSSPDNPDTPNGLSSWVEETQVRVNLRSSFTDDDDNQANTNSYSIRVKPKGWGQRDAELKILELQAHQQEAHYQQAVHRAFLQRYQIVLALIAQQHETLRLLSAQALAEKETKLHRIQFNTSEFNPEALLDAEIVLRQANNATQFALQRLNALQKQLQLPQDSATSLQQKDLLSWLASPDDLLNNLPKNADDLAPSIQEAQLNLDLARAEHLRVKTREQVGVNLVGLHFQDHAQDKLGVLLGVNIPLGSENFNTTTQRYKVLDAQAALIEKTANLEQSLKEKLAKMAALTDQWHLAQTQIKDMEMLASRLQNDSAQTKPQLALKVDKELLKLRSDLSKLHQQILDVYIDYLATNGQLAAMPLRNWLSKDTPSLPTNF